MKESMENMYGIIAAVIFLLGMILLLPLAVVAWLVGLYLLLGLTLALLILLKMKQGYFMYLRSILRLD